MFIESLQADCKGGISYNFVENSIGRSSYSFNFSTDCRRTLIGDRQIVWRISHPRSIPMPRQQPCGTTRRCARQSFAKTGIVGGIAATAASVFAHAKRLCGVGRHHV